MVVSYIPVSKEEDTAHTQNDAHATKIEGNSCFDRDNMLHYNKKIMIQYKKSYMYLLVAMVCALP